MTSRRVACQPEPRAARPKLSVVGSAATSPAAVAPTSRRPAPCAATDSRGSSRAEPASRFYQVSRDPQDPRVFFFFEIYDDEDGYKAHGESEHFKRLGFGEAIPLLDSRERWFYETID